MGVDLLLLRRTLKNVSTSFSDATFTGFSLKISSTTLTIKYGLSWFLSLMNPITNSSRLKSKMVPTNYFYQLLLKIFIEERNRIIPGFGEGMDKGKKTNPPPPPIWTPPPPPPLF